MEEGRWAFSLKKILTKRIGLLASTMYASIQTQLVVLGGGLTVLEERDEYPGG